MRIRAAEFLGLNAGVDPRPVIMDVLRQVTNPTEANLILNSAALLEDARPGYDFDLKEFDSAAWTKGKKSLAVHRLEYLKK